jgi:predicted phage replisome organizer
VASEKRYFWLKFDKGFMDKRIKKLRKIAGGDTYTIIYLKMILSSIETGGIIKYEGVESSLAEEIALDLDEDTDNVQVTVNFLMSQGLLVDAGNGDYALPYAQERIGSESASAKRVREHRERQKEGLTVVSDSKAKSNAQRQKMFRAKEKCKEKQHVPFIEDYVNNKRYGGNYYIVIKRDKYKCACCGSIENLCVHHIDGYDENKPENNNANKMITVCRECHSNIHAGAKIDEDILESIDYYSNEMLPSNAPVTEQLRTCNVEKRREEIEKDIDIYNNSLSNDKEYIESDVEPVITDSTHDAPVDSNLTHKDDLKVEGEELHPKRDRIDYRGIQNDYNAICVSFPMCKLLSDKRKKEIKACVNNGITRADFRRAFEKAQESSFMKGNNNRGWQASFDWIIKLNNLVKILDGNYDNKQNAPTSPKFAPKSEVKDELDNFYTEINEWANKGN